MSRGWGGYATNITAKRVGMTTAGEGDGAGRNAEQGSVFESLPDDPASIVFSKDEFNVSADGAGDNAPALQKAIDRFRAWDDGGIVFIPSGVYRLGSTVNVWRGVRLIGFGPERPVFLLGANTPGFSEGGPEYLIQFCDGTDESGEPNNASFVTFFSGLWNIDVEIEDGNPDAVAVRFNVAQHSFLRDMEFRLGSAAAGIVEAGNEIERCRFIKGRVGVSTFRTSACWPFVMLDCSFDGQRETAVESCRAGLTAVRCEFRNTPLGIRIPEGGDIEQLLVRNCNFQDIGESAILSLSPANAENMVNVLDSTFAGTPFLLSWKNGAAEPVAANADDVTHVQRLCHGLQIKDAVSRKASFGSTRDIGPDAELITVVESGPDSSSRPERFKYSKVPPVAVWQSVRDFGAAGDGETDDTEAIRRALAEGRVVYFPLGVYRVSDTINVPEGSWLIGLNPGYTCISLQNGSRGFASRLAPKPILETCAGGFAGIMGLRVAQNRNPGAVGILWRAGEGSVADDVFLRSRQKWGEPPQPAHHSLWIKDKAGGDFRAIWSEDRGALSGVRIENTVTPGSMLCVSVEHHNIVEISVENVSNWDFLAMQTEATIKPEEALALAVELRECSNLTFANSFLYRSRRIRTTYPYAIRVESCSNLLFLNTHVFSWGPHPFENALHNPETEMYIRHRETASMTVI